MHQPHFVYPFICWRTLGLLPLLPLWIMLLWTRVYTHLFGSLMSHLVGIYPEVRGCCCFFFFKDTCGAFTWYIQKAQKYIQWKFFLPLLSSVTQFQFINIFCRLCFWYLEKAMAPHSSTLAWKIHRHRSLAGYSPSGQKELDTAEWLNMIINYTHHAAAAKSLQSGPTLCDPTEGSPPGFSVPGILQARTLEWVAIPFSNACKWKVKVKSLSRVRLLVTPWTTAYQAPLSMGFSRKEYWSGLPLPSPICKANANKYERGN